MPRARAWASRPSAPHVGRVAVAAGAPAIVAIVSLFGCSVSAPAAAARVMEPRAAPGPVARPEGDRPPRLDVRCEDPATCPESVGMLVAPAPDRPERCTATLVGRSRVVTAAHCVTPVFGEPASCDDTWVAFPEAGEHPMTWVRCARVVRASPLPDEDVLRPDFAVLELAEPVARRALSVASRPTEEGRVVSVAVVTPNRIYATQHELTVRLCRVGSKTEMAAELGPKANRVGWLRDCPIFPGNSGAPVLDADGRIAALVHGGSNPFFGVGVTTDARLLRPVVRARPHPELETRPSAHD